MYTLPICHQIQVCLGPIQPWVRQLKEWPRTFKDNDPVTPFYFQALTQNIFLKQFYTSVQSGNYGEGHGEGRLSVDIGVAVAKNAMISSIAGALLWKISVQMYILEINQYAFGIFGQKISITLSTTISCTLDEVRSRVKSMLILCQMILILILKK